MTSVLLAVVGLIAFAMVFLAGMAMGYALAELEHRNKEKTLLGLEKRYQQ